jgi:hypothetical protein
LQRAEALLGKISEQFPLGMLHWGLAMTNIEAMRIDEALAASLKAIDIFERLGNRELWARVARNHGRFLMVKGKLARATALLDEVAGAAVGFANPDAFQYVNWSCG